MLKYFLFSFWADLETPRCQAITRKVFQFIPCLFVKKVHFRNQSRNRHLRSSEVSVILLNFNQGPIKLLSSLFAIQRCVRNLSIRRRFIRMWWLDCKKLRKHLSCHFDHEHLFSVWVSRRFQVYLRFQILLELSNNSQVLLHQVYWLVLTIGTLNHLRLDARLQLVTHIILLKLINTRTAQSNSKWVAASPTLFRWSLCPSSLRASV